ncbi:winged helix-turn-helix domain-containing protein [Patescibacteria group bacterium]|nr:winged helix-turn-helix domain-containing protein [Patescibacteria group bacterium]
MALLASGKLISALNKTGVASCLTLPTKEKRAFLKELLKNLENKNLGPVYIDTRLCQYVSLSNFLKLCLIILSKSGYQKTLPQLTSTDEKGDEFLLLAAIKGQLKKITADKRTVLVIDNVEPFFIFGSTLFLNLESLLDLYFPQLNLVFIFSSNILSTRLEKKLHGNNLIYRHIFFFPPVQIDQKEAELIFSGTFVEDERMMRLIAHQAPNIKEQFRKVSVFWKEMGLISTKGSKWKITNPYLDNLATQINPLKQNKFHQKAGKIYLNREDITNIFSSNEQEILKKLISKRGKVLTRDEISHILWGKEWEDKHSDWAIDKTISRIRGKLIKVWLGKNILKTVKGQGIKLDV